MRKLKLQMQISIDGFVSTGPNDEQRWVTWAWKEIEPYVLALHDSADTQLLGRKLGADFIPYWQEAVKDTGAEMHELAKRTVAMKKVVFTHTLEDVAWPNSSLAKGDLREEVNNLKNQAGKDILVVGGSSFVSSLIEANLIDEFHLYVNPVALGKGEPIFDKVKPPYALKLVKSVAFNSGLVLNQYIRN